MNRLITGGSLALDPDTGLPMADLQDTTDYEAGGRMAQPRPALTNTFTQMGTAQRIDDFDRQPFQPPSAAVAATPSPMPASVMSPGDVLKNTGISLDASTAPRSVWDFVPQSQRGYQALGFTPTQAMTGGSRDTSRVRGAGSYLHTAMSADEADRGRRAALTDALLTHVIPHYFSATGAIGAAGEQAAGKVSAARETAMGQMGTQQIRNEGAMEQRAGDLEAIKSMPNLAKAGVFSVAPPERPTVVPSGGMAIRGGQTVATNPKPEPAAKPEKKEKPHIVTDDKGGVWHVRENSAGHLERYKIPEVEPAATAQTTLPQPPKAGARIDAATVKLYLNAHGGDKDKARQAARAAGWDLTTQ